MKKGLLVLIVIIVIALAAYWYFVYQAPAEPAPVAAESATTLEEAADDITDTISDSVLPSVTLPNAAEKISEDVNPVEKSNPFADLKINPFE